MRNEKRGMRSQRFRRLSFPRIGSVAIRKRERVEQVEILFCGNGKIVCVRLIKAHLELKNSLRLITKGQKNLVKGQTFRICITIVP